MEVSVVTFETSLVIPRPLAATFDFVSDFRNAPRWDPRTYDAKQLTAGPVGLGSKFLLLGGLITKHTRERFHIPNFLMHPRELHYEVVSFVPRSELVLRGETSTLHYEDHLRFSGDGDTTRLHYTATLGLKGALRIGDVIARPLFEAIGSDATSGIPSAVESVVPAPAPAIASELPASPIIGIANVQRVVALDTVPVLRNLLITQGYHDVSSAIRERTGGGDMNWCTLGSWASKTAGSFIRDEEVPKIFRALLASPGVLRAGIDNVQTMLTREAGAEPHRLIDVAREVVHDCSTYIMAGNRVVYAELAQCCAAFVQVLGDDTAPDPAKLAAFQAQYLEGDPLPDAVEWGPSRTLIPHQRGGQSMLRGMVEQLYRAKFETDPKRRAELILLANAQGGLHEQTRLQTYIAGGINAPLTDTLVAWAHKHIDRNAPEPSRGRLHNAIDAALPALGRELERAWQDFSTDLLMTLTLPDAVLHLGHSLPQEPGIPYWPAALAKIEDPALAAVLAKYGALDVRFDRSTYDWLKQRIRSLFGESTSPDERAHVGALDWVNFDQRMRYILTLFRSRQQDVQLFKQPFTDAQRTAVHDGRVPSGPL